MKLFHTDMTTEGAVATGIRYSSPGKPMIVTTTCISPNITNEHW